MKINMLFYSHRLKLAKMFDSWADKNNIKKCPENLIAFLCGHDLIDIERALEFIKTNEEADL